jgi:hypothetical protein
MQYIHYPIHGENLGSLLANWSLLAKVFPFRHATGIIIHKCQKLAAVVGKRSVVGLQIRLKGVQSLDQGLERCLDDLHISNSLRTEDIAFKINLSSFLMRKSVNQGKVDIKADRWITEL